MQCELRNIQIVTIDESAIVAKTDPSGIITVVNDKFCAISKYSREELVGKTHKIINSKHHPKSFFKNLWKTISSGQVWVGEIKNRAKDGTFYWVMTTIIPVFDTQNVIEEYISIRQDITETKNIQRLQEKQVKQLEDYNLELERYAYITSHDLQEPLITLNRATKILKNNYQNSFEKDVIKLIDILDVSSERMSKLIHGIFHHSQIGQKRKTELIDLKTEIEQIKATYSSLIQEKNAQINLKNNVLFNSDPLLVNLIFSALIENALKFVEPPIQPKVEISVNKEPNSIVFAVSDNGIGISQNQIPQIFNMLYKEHPQEKFEGLGIGLANCKKAVKLLKGKIWVESTLDGGSIFYVRIPNQ